MSSGSSSSEKQDSLSSEKEISLRIYEKPEVKNQSIFNRITAEDSVYSTEYDSSLNSHHIRKINSDEKEEKDQVPNPVGCYTNSSPSYSHNVIQDYVLVCSQSPSSLLGRCINIFIQCTLNTTVRDPEIVMRNVRQFMNGCKNYLIRTGEGEISQLIDLQQAKLRSHEYLNIDSILEDTMHLLIIKPLRNHIRDLIVTKYIDNGYFGEVEESIGKYSKSLDSQTNSNKDMKKGLADVLESLETGFSPVHKLSSLTRLYTRTLHQGVNREVGEFTQHLATLIATSNTWSSFQIIRVEVDYVRGLLPAPLLLQGEAGYFLDLTRSVLYALTDLQTRYSNPQNLSVPVTLPSDRQNVSCSSDHLSTRRVPVYPGISVRSLTTSASFIFRLAEGNQHSLYLVRKGKECKLTDEKLSLHEDLQEVNIAKATLIFKRSDSNIILPASMSVRQ